MRRLLVAGGSGYLGSQVIRAAQGWDICATYLSRSFRLTQGETRRLDLRDEGAVNDLVRATRPDVIVHTACSNQSAGDIAAIIPAARNLARAARESAIRLIHISTDLVFDGEHPPYADDSPPAPLGEYGSAKAEAEAIVSHLCPSALIVRPSLIWSLDPLDHQTRWLVEGVQRGQPITLFTDEFRCPVHVHDLSAALLELAARQDLAGLMNMGGPQSLNRWDLGMKLLAALHLMPGPNVVRGLVKESGHIRARDLTMASTRAGHLLNTGLRTVDEVLDSSERREY